MTFIARLGTATTISVLLGSWAQAASLNAPALAYALGNEGTTLVTVASPSGGAAGGVDLSFAGGKRTSLDILAYRPKTMQLYGYDDEGDTVYEIDRTTGMTTAVVANRGVTTKDDAGFDFNNVLDAARIVTAEGENVVFFPNNTPPTLEPKTKLFYVPGDANEGKIPNVVMNAYTNAVPDATATEQFVIDTDLNALAMLGNNAGTLMTVGGLYFNDEVFDVTEDGGFDILSFFEGNNTAYALLTNGSKQGLYQVPMQADAMGRVNLSFIADVTTDFGTLDGFAVLPAGNTPAPVPVPAALGLLGLGLAALGAIRARRRTA